ncbi:MAG: dioxygenase [Spirochaetaceae bacterium]|nr:dioxygenase [Spirochaetaceae bacterium]
MGSIRKLPTYYLPHGGGPWHVMKEDFGPDSGYDALEAYLVALGRRHGGEVSSILMVSAHWEEPRATLHFGAKPGMFFDYGGFPEHAYRLSYPAPGDPGLAEKTEALLRGAGIGSGRETARGYDHGAFVPLMVAFPAAAIPVVQLSLVEGLDPAAHFALGRALEPLRSEGTLILGSGMSYHNLRGLLSGSPGVAESSRRFDDWLAAAVALADPEARRAALLEWEKAPSARECHPRSEHLVPLFVAAGAAGADPGRREYSGRLMGASVSSHVFGA